MGQPLPSWEDKEAWSWKATKISQERGAEGLNPSEMISELPEYIKYLLEVLAIDGQILLLGRCSCLTILATLEFRFYLRLTTHRYFTQCTRRMEACCGL